MVLFAADMHLVPLDYALIVAYLVMMAIIGAFFGWFVKDAAAFLKGGNTIPWVVAGTSNFMSMFSTFVFVAYAGIAYEHGLVAVTVFWSTVPACLIAAWFLAARWRRAEVTTPMEYLGLRFGPAVCQVFSWVGLVMRLLDNAVRLYAAGLFLATVTPISLEQAVVVSGLLITLFTVIGGLWAVTVMDTIQFIVLLLATLILVPLALNEAGGFAGIQAAAPRNLTWLNGPKGAPLWLLVYYMMITLKYNANWAFIQRLYSVRDEKAARKVAYCSAFLFLVSPLIFLLPAVAARSFLPNLDDPERAYVAACAVLLPPGMMGLMIASMFSATMSALNSEFNVMAGVMTNDIYRRFARSEASGERLMWIARAATVLVGGLITVGALLVGYVGGAFDANKLFTGILAIPLAVPLIFGITSRWPTPTGAVATVLIGASLALVLNVGGYLPWDVTTLIVMVVSVAALLLISLTRRPLLAESGRPLLAESGRPLLAESGRPSGQQREKQARLMNQLTTPLPADRVATLDPRFRSALGGLFGLSLLTSGGFFLLVGVLAVDHMSGRLALLAGLACCLVGAVLWRWRNR